MNEQSIHHFITNGNILSPNFLDDLDSGGCQEESLMSSFSIIAAFFLIQMSVLLIGIRNCHIPSYLYEPHCYDLLIYLKYIDQLRFWSKLLFKLSSNPDIRMCLYGICNTIQKLRWTYTKFISTGNLHASHIPVK